MDDKPLTRKALAAALGVSGAMVTKAARRGMPTHSVEAARRWRAASVRERAGSAPPPAAPPADGAHVSYQEARRREAVARATAAETDVAERRGELIAVERLRRVMGARMVPAREILRGVGARVGPLVAGLDAAQAAAALDAEMRRVEAELRALADDFANLKGATDAEAQIH